MRAATLDAAAIEALVEARHADPFALLGPHPAPGGSVIRAFAPDAERLEILPAGDGGAAFAMERRHKAGLFEGFAALDPGAAYRLRAANAHGEWEFDDPYRFPPVLGELDDYLIREGTHRRLWEKLGAHAMAHAGAEGVHFAVWAPNASRVSVVADFNSWDGRRHPMRCRGGTGVWELFIPGIGEGALYKYEIRAGDGRVLPLKSDPLGAGAELRPKSASVVRDGRFDWSDGAWMSRRAAAQSVSAPVSIYEAHLGSWRRAADGGFLSYDELAETLIPYVRDMGFTHLELMPVSEYPFDGSWGYQPIGLFAPTSRHGTPVQFARFVNACHEAGVGLILDWVASHFPEDAHGLGQFDGTHLYEHADPKRGYHPDWRSLIYNYGRAEVANYLHANALYWLERFHVDGLRVDAVASMLYLDYSRKDGEWTPNEHGGRENLEAMAFLRRMNELAYGQDASIMTVAEESTAWPAVSRPTWMGGLGFGFKWNMGWMHDTLKYMQKDPVHRRWHHHHMTFGLLYAFSENFVLPLSHDEVVHGKGSILGRMPGDEWRRFANLRAYYGFMWGHPGKKLLFMGQDFGQPWEWSHDSGLPWHLLEYPLHAGAQKLVRDLNRIYRATPALHQRDCDPSGFEWIEANDQERSVYAWLRRGEDGAPPVAVACNFTPAPREGYRIGLPHGGLWREILNTDAGDYGGSGMGNFGAVSAEPTPWHGRPYSASVTLPPLATVWFEGQA